MKVLNYFQGHHCEADCGSARKGSRTQDFKKLRPYVLHQVTAAVQAAD